MKGKNRAKEVKKRVERIQSMVEAGFQMSVEGASKKDMNRLSCMIAREDRALNGIFRTWKVQPLKQSLDNLGKRFDRQHMLDLELRGVDTDGDDFIPFVGPSDIRHLGAQVVSLKMAGFYNNDFDQDKYVCPECFSYNGQNEAGRLLNEGISDDRERFYFQRLVFIHDRMYCAVCGNKIV